MRQLPIWLMVAVIVGAGTVGAARWIARSPDAEREGVVIALAPRVDRPATAARMAPPAPDKSRAARRVAAKPLSATASPKVSPPAVVSEPTTMQVLDAPDAERRADAPEASAEPDPAAAAPIVPNAPTDPLPAREALRLVGADPQAEAVWSAAINDASLPPEARKDLIEDLNEAGFPDPARPSPDDLPLIESRMALIERLAPQAMDETNMAAFAEAYKDLMNMHARASR